MKKQKVRIEHIYIHVPFCLQKCGYCSFYSLKFDPNKKARYLTALYQEIAFYQERFQLKPRTIYFGGGTPSLLQPDEIRAILQKFDVQNLQKVTMEANPININRKYAAAIAATSINRISLGIQSFVDEELELLGRLHNAKQAEAAYLHLRNAGFKNFSFDLIYGLPGQTKTNLLQSLKKFLALEPEHISTYCLSLESGVPLFPRKKEIPVDDIVSEFYYLIRSRLLQAGYQQYEISNFAKPGCESKHNLSYWNDKFYLGLGPAASGYLPNKINRLRYTNPADLGVYCRQLESKQVKPKIDRIEPDKHEKEYIFLSLRKTEGLDMVKFRDRFGRDFRKKYKLIIDKYRLHNLVEIEGDYIRLSPEAYFISNEILSEFV